MLHRPAATATTSVRGRILGLVFLPVLCLVVLAGQQAAARQAAAGDAGRSHRLVEAYLELGRLRSGIQLEWAATAGAAQLRDAGVRPDDPVVAALIGFDTVGAALDYAARNDECQDELPGLLVAAGIDAGAVITALDGRRGLAPAVVDGATEGTGLVAVEVDERYRAVDDALDTVQQQLHGALADAATGDGQGWDRLRAELAVTDDAVEWVNAVATETRLLTQMASSGARRADDLYALGAARHAELASLGRLRASPLWPLLALDDADRARWEASRKLAADAAGFSEAGVADGDAFTGGGPVLQRQEVLSGFQVQRAAAAVPVATDGIMMADHGADAFDAVATRADATVDALTGDARRSAAVSLALLVAALAVCVALAALTIRGITEPLAALTAQAEAIRDGGSGDSATGAGPVAGTPARRRFERLRRRRAPAEIAVVGAALDELDANLSLLTRQAAALAAGRLHDPVLERSVPGRLGESLRSSVSRLSELTDRLSRQARRDPMTGVANRAAVVERVEEAVARARRTGQPIGLLHADLDEFKSVNDAFGHEQGDALLRVVAQRLERFASGERLCGRLGADEFAVVVEDVDVASTLVELGEELVAAVQEPIDLDGHTYRLSMSVGAALSRPDQDAAGLLRDAGQAAADAKRQGKGRVQVFDPAVQEALERRARVQHDLRRAIVDDEFELFLQPVIETATGRVEGAEGLIRWRLDDGTIVPPNEFIPIAEESALIVDIGRLVIAKACRLLAEWAATGRGALHVAINVGGRHVTNGTLAEDIRSQLDRFGVPAERLVVELTESNLVSDLELAAGVLGELRDLGVQIALDDFGTGYSSLSYLRRLPIDTMKLDRSYVNGLGCDDQETSIVRSLVQLAESLDLDVVAEGVETDVQLEHLRRLGCRSVQGFLLARPMPSAQFDEWLLDHIPVGTVAVADGEGRGPSVAEAA